MSDADKLIFHTSPVITFATNHFVDVPVILQVNDQPLVEVVAGAEAGFTTRFSIFHSDGTDLARVVGSQIFATEAGKKAGLVLRHPDKKTVCEMGGKTVFEIERTEAAALKTQAEIYTPSGRFLRIHEGVEGFDHRDGSPLQIGGAMLSNNSVRGTAIGVLLRTADFTGAVGRVGFSLTLM